MKIFPRGSISYSAYVLTQNKEKRILEVPKNDQNMNDLTIKFCLFRKYNEQILEIFTFVILTSFSFTNILSSMIWRLFRYDDFYAPKL